MLPFPQLPDTGGRMEVTRSTEAWCNTWKLFCLSVGMLSPQRACTFSSRADISKQLQPWRWHGQSRKKNSVEYPWQMKPRIHGRRLKMKLRERVFKETSSS